MTGGILKVKPRERLPVSDDGFADLQEVLKALQTADDEVEALVAISERGSSGQRRMELQKGPPSLQAAP